MLVVVGITGGIAAYKAVGVVRGLVLAGHDVHVVATAAALRFVGRPTLEAISRNPVETELFDGVAEVRHVALGQSADLIVVAPATRDNVATLLRRGVHIVGPASGQLTGTDSGQGRMAEPSDIVEAALAAVRPRDLAGRRILVTAGGTREPLDPVRFIGNRSSGRQGVAIAEAAAARGAEVTLIAANVESALLSGIGFEVRTVSTTAELRDAALAAAVGSDLVVMAAAVADYRPE